MRTAVGWHTQHALLRTPGVKRALKRRNSSRSRDPGGLGRRRTGEQLELCGRTAVVTRVRESPHVIRWGEHEAGRATRVAISKPAYRLPRAGISPPPEDERPITGPFANLPGHFPEGTTSIIHRNHKTTATSSNVTSPSRAPPPRHAWPLLVLWAGGTGSGGAPAARAPGC